MSRIRVREAIIVEGKYDKIKLEALVDGLIITTEGFGIFKDKEKKAFIRRLADERGILVITDSDGAGFVIRNHIAGFVDVAKLKHAYIPQQLGKERRKSAPSKEGMLGVEGMDAAVLQEALRQAGVTMDSSIGCGEPVTRERLFDDGFIGGEGSALRRQALLRELALPTYLSTSALLKVINAVVDMESYTKAVGRINDGANECSKH